MTLTIPDERIGNLKLGERDVMTDIAIGLYKRERVSLGRAAEIAGVLSIAHSRCPFRGRKAPQLPQRLPPPHADARRQMSLTAYFAFVTRAE
jgi:hypothetical protein